MPPATVTQCAVLVGGLGTRLGALTAATPKPILPCGDRPFLAWLLREFVRFGVTDFLLLTGHLSAEIEKAAATIQADTSWNYYHWFVDCLPRTYLLARASVKEPVALLVPEPVAPFQVELPKPAPPLMPT